MTERPPLEVWRATLERQGHRLVEPEANTLTGFSVWPDADSIITVATEPDTVLHRHYRQRFFLCPGGPEQVFQQLSCPEQHWARWAELVSRQPPGNWQDFLAGPGSWLLSRLARFPRVVAWADRGLPWEVLDDPMHRGWGVWIPTAVREFFASLGPDAGRPRLFASSHERFADAVGACLLFASVGTRDCYLADEGGTEVYLAHHHDKVVVSIPDAGRRAALLQELLAAPSLFPDVSGYDSPLDEEQDEQKNRGESPGTD
jgi:hypothetical protein